MTEDCLENRSMKREIKILVNEEDNHAKGLCDDLTYSLEKKRDGQTEPDYAVFTGIIEVENPLVVIMIGNNDRNICELLRDYKMGTACIYVPPEGDAEDLNAGYREDDFFVVSYSVRSIIDCIRIIESEKGLEPLVEYKIRVKGEVNRVGEEEDEVEVAEDTGE